MTEPLIALCLNQEQRQHLFAHLLVYLFSFIVHASASEQQQVRKPILEVAYRLRHLNPETREGIVFALSRQEAAALKEVLTSLQSIYEHSLPIDEIRVLALSYLTLFRSLLEEAE